MTYRDVVIAFTVVIVVVSILGFTIGQYLEKLDHTQAQIVAVAEDLGCTYIEQSYHHPENYYIDCGDDNIRIIKIEDK